MFYLVEHQGKEQYDMKDFVCDTPDDIVHLPLDCAMGSTCFCISTSEAYMLNSLGEWVKL